MQIVWLKRCYQHIEATSFITVHVLGSMKVSQIKDRPGFSSASVIERHHFHIPTILLKYDVTWVIHPLDDIQHTLCTNVMLPLTHFTVVFRHGLSSLTHIHYNGQILNRSPSPGVFGHLLN